MNHLINWIEIPVTDLARAKTFYAAILGEELSEMEMGGMQYALFPSKDTFNNGALVKGEHYRPSGDGLLVYLNGGQDLDIILKKVEPSGGTILMEKTFLSKEAGYVGMFLDSEGNKIGLQNN